MAIRKKESTSKVPDYKIIMRKLNTISKKKDSLIKEQSKLEVESENLKEELEELEDEVKAEFGTTDPTKLEAKKNELLLEAEKLLKEVEI